MIKAEEAQWNTMPYFLWQLTDDKSESWSSVWEWKCSLMKLGSNPFLRVQPPDMFLPVYSISELNWICQSESGRADGGLSLVTVRARWGYSSNTPTLACVWWHLVQLSVQHFLEDVRSAQPFLRVHLWRASSLHNRSSRRPHPTKACCIVCFVGLQQRGS